MEPRKPSRLNPGDLIGIISPASRILDPSRIEKGVAYLERMGYRTVLGKHVLETYGYLAGTDEERVADIHDMFTHKDVKAIMCIRGGYGTPRLLSLIDYSLVARHPKIFVGYSDITSLQLALWKKSRLVTFQGPMVGVDLADPLDSMTEEIFWRLLTSPKKAGQVIPPEEPAVLVRKGKASGRLLGGNLAHLVAILGTVHQPSFTDSILFLEDIGEEPYRIDRMMTQLRHAAILENARALLTGQFTDCSPKDPAKPSLSLETIFREIGTMVPVPFLAGLPFGHEARKITIPMGIRARVNTEAHTLEYLEGAVI
ncbi:MAG: ldcA [Bacteroidetes bacterium]|nr:ldcA [Bacteroidota bacterium]